MKFNVGDRVRYVGSDADEFECNEGTVTSAGDCCVEVVFDDTAPGADVFTDREFSDLEWMPSPLLRSAMKQYFDNLRDPCPEAWAVGGPLAPSAEVAHGEPEAQDQSAKVAELESEITDLLFELDEMQDIVSKTVEAREAAEADRDYWKDRAEILVDSRDHWIDQADSYLNYGVALSRELDEMKAALRTLGGGR